MVNIDLRKLSAPIEALRPALSDAYKRLDAKWVDIADALKSLPIPTDVSFRYWIDEYNGNEYSYLVWKKWNGTKRVCIEHHSLDQSCPVLDYDVTTTPYEEWSGQQRIDMLEHVPGLFEAAAKATQDFINKSKI